MNDNTTSIDQNLNRVLYQIEQDCLRYQRPSGSVRLLAVSKRKPVSVIREAAAAGQLAFGENYVDEAIEKIQSINNDKLEWHFIGAIQSRKTAAIAEHFQWAHSVDRLKIAQRLSKQRPAGLPPLNICLQIKLDDEPDKAGLSLSELPPLADECANLPGLSLRGLMAIPAPRSQFEEQRAVFSRLREALISLQQQYPSLDTLSMGMSGDMDAAIAEGATIVRVGTAIFGPRD